MRPPACVCWWYSCSVDWLTNGQRNWQYKSVGRRHQNRELLPSEEDQNNFVMIQHNSQETESDWSTVTRRKVSRTKKFRAVKRRSSLSTIPETISEEEVNFSSEAEDERVEINLRPGYQSPSQWARGNSSYFRQFSGDDQPAPVSTQRQRQFEDDGRGKREGGCCSILIKLDNIRDKVSSD